MANWVIRMIYAAGYPAVVLLTLVENVFPPIPSEVIMPLTGYMAARGQLSLFGAIAAGTLGSVLGALPLYYAGRKLGERRLMELADRRGRWLTVSRTDVERAKRWFDRHGGAAVFFCRLLPGVRSLISIPAGIAEMNLAAFLAYSALGSALWTALLTYLGYWLGDRFEKVGEYLDPASWVVLGGLAVLYAWRVATHKGERGERRSAQKTSRPRRPARRGRERKEQ